ncbi:MAG: zf-HC2 domain-containing protein [Planctomycetes bacterium]|nr:zf-HC2 domain-containing protein [Planctomycetota bacterium]
MTCDKIKSLLQYYLDAECSSEHNALVSKHLDECSDCRNHWAMLKKITSLPVSPVEEPSVDLCDRIIANIQEENIRVAEAKAAGGRWRYFLPLYKNHGQWKFAATIILPLVLGLVFYWKYSAERDQEINPASGLVAEYTTNKQDNEPSTVNTGYQDDSGKTDEAGSEYSIQRYGNRITESEIEQLIQQLGDEEIQKQEFAQEQIIQLGVTVYPFLVQKLEKTSDPEVKNRLVSILFSE